MQLTSTLGEYMYIKDNQNQYIKAEFSLCYENGENSIIIESRSGRPLRNPDYNELLTRILEIIKSDGVNILAIYLASHRSVEISRENRLINIDNRPYPISLVDIDVEEFRRSLQQKIARTESDSQNGGNRQKRIQIVVNPQISIDNSENDESEYISSIINETERDDIVKARIGQGKFRRDVARICQNKCIVTGATIDEVLVASHIKPWKVCNNQERLDGNNGLFLAATYDKLFDRGLISFRENGQIMISSRLNEENVLVIGINREFVLGNISRYNKYLEYHRNNLFIA